MRIQQPCQMGIRVRNQSVPFAIGSLLILYFLLGFEPIKRALISIEPRCVLFLIILALLGASVGWAATFVKSRVLRKAVRITEIRLTRLLKCWGLSISMILWILPILATRNLQYPTTDVGYNMLLGAMPTSDARNYYEGASSLIHFGVLDAWNERRPLNATLLSVRLALAGLDLYGALLLQSMMIAYASLFLARVVTLLFGLHPGILTFACMLGFGRMYVALPLSETLGLTLGGLGVGMVLLAAKRADFAPVATGIWGLSLGMNARIGAVLVLPMLIGWYFERLRGGKYIFRPGVCLLAIVTLAWVHNTALRNAYGPKQGALNANFAYTLCGLSIGSNWSEAERRYSHQLQQLHSESERVSFLYEKSWENVKKNPAIALEQYWGRLQIFAADFPNGILEPLLTGVGDSNVARASLIVPLAFLLVCGTLLVLRSCRARTVASLYVWVGWGILLSAPFLWLDGGGRVFATTHPFVSAIFGVAGYHPATIAPGSGRLQRRYTRTATIILLIIPLVALLGPALLHPIMRLSEADKIITSKGDLSIFDGRTLKDGVYVGTDSGGLLSDHLHVSPTILEHDARFSALSRDQIQQLKMLDLPFVLLSSFDLRSRQVHLVAIPPQDYATLSFKTPLLARPIDKFMSVSEVHE